jgi:AcrR family transcriptional regulator
MTSEELEARARILQSVLDILNEDTNLDDITVRQIAKRAGVGIGLINYHFQSKENLLQAAVSQAGGEIADQWKSSLDPSIQDPIERLKSMLKVNAAVGVANSKFASIAIRYELLKGEMSTCQVILPILREICGSAKTEGEIKLISFILVSSLQLMFIRERAFKKYAEVDISNSQQRDRTIDFLVDTILQPKR